MSVHHVILLFGLSSLLSFSANASLSVHALSEPEDQEQALRWMQHEVHREHGVRSEHQLEILDQLAQLYLQREDFVDAVANASFAYELRLESGTQDAVRFQAESQSFYRVPRLLGSRSHFDGEMCCCG